jgi:hypothetical protein
MPLETDLLIDENVTIAVERECVRWRSLMQIFTKNFTVDESSDINDEWFLNKTVCRYVFMMDVITVVLEVLVFIKDIFAFKGLGSLNQLQGSEFRPSVLLSSLRIVGTDLDLCYVQLVLIHRNLSERFYQGAMPC